MARTPGGLIIPESVRIQTLGLVLPHSPLAGLAPPPLPPWMRLYPDTDQLLWSGTQLLERQASFSTRSGVVHMLLEQLQLVLDFAATFDNQGEACRVEDLTFTLDASLPIADYIRKYKFDLDYPTRGKVEIQEFLQFGEHHWRYFIEVRGGTYHIREVTGLVDKFGGEERKLSNGRKVRVVLQQQERQLDL